MKSRKFKFLDNSKFFLIVQFFIFLYAFVLEISHVSKLHIGYFWIIILFLLNFFLIFVINFRYFLTYKYLFKRIISMDLLIALAAHITFFYSCADLAYKIIYQEKINLSFLVIPPGVLFFINIGHFLENKIKLKSGLEIQKLLNMQPKTALIFNEKSQNFEEIDCYKLVKNNIVLVRKGEVFPVDCELLDARAIIDSSNITGESLYQEILPGQIIFSGSINFGNSVKVKVIENVEKSKLNSLIVNLEKITFTKSSFERVSDKIVKWFIPTIFFVAFLAFFLWGFIPNFETKIGIEKASQKIINPNWNSWKKAIFVFVSLITVACPCAFGITTPLAIFSASATASQNKIVFASAKAFEKIANINFFAFDKTGTLTNNTPQIVSVIGNQNFLDLLSFVEQKSTHPLAKVITNFVNKKNLFFDKVENFEEKPGFGLTFSFQGNNYEVSSYQKFLTKKYSWKFPVQDETLKIYFTNVSLAENGKIVLVINIFDEAKPDARKYVKKFLQKGIKLILVSGDNLKNVADFAHKVGIETFYGEMSPEKKADIIQKYQQKKYKVAFIGDGINDILALKTADLALSYSSGSDVANSLADIILMEKDVNLVYKAHFLGKKTVNLIKKNFIWGFFFNFFAIPLAFFGLIFPWLGVFLMVSSSIFVILNTIINKALISKKIKKI